MGIARANGWVQPTVYQGRYNALDRAIEPEYVFEHPNASCPHFIAWQTHSLLAEVRHHILRLQPTGVRTIPVTLIRSRVCFR